MVEHVGSIGAVWAAALCKAANLVTVPSLRARIREPAYTLILHKTISGVRDLCRKAGGNPVLGVAGSAVLYPVLLSVVDCRPPIGPLLPRALAVLDAHGDYDDVAAAAGQRGDGECNVFMRAHRRSVIESIMSAIEVVGVGKGAPLPGDVLERVCDGPPLTPGELMPLISGRKEGGAPSYGLLSSEGSTKIAALRALAARGSSGSTVRDHVDVDGDSAMASVQAMDGGDTTVRTRSRLALLLLSCH